MKTQDEVTAAIEQFETHIDAQGPEPVWFHLESGEEVQLLSLEIQDDHIEIRYVNEDYDFGDGYYTVNTPTDDDIGMLEVGFDSPQLEEICTLLQQYTDEDAEEFENTFGRDKEEPDESTVYGRVRKKRLEWDKKDVSGPERNAYIHLELALDHGDQDLEKARQSILCSLVILEGRPAWASEENVKGWERETEAMQHALYEEFGPDPGTDEAQKQWYRDQAAAQRAQYPEPPPAPDLTDLSPEEVLSKLIGWKHLDRRVIKHKNIWIGGHLYLLKDLEAMKLQQLRPIYVEFLKQQQWNPLSERDLKAIRKSQIYEEIEHEANRDVNTFYRDVCDAEMACPKAYDSQLYPIFDEMKREKREQEEE